MADVTYFVALPFLLNEEGELVPGEAQDRPHAHGAIRTAEDMARRFGGAVAFSRTGDPNIGEFKPAVVLRTFGTVPDLGEMFGG